MRRLIISAGEVSGEQHAARLAAELRARAPGLALDCMGGRLLERAGARLIFPLCEFAVLGIWQVLRQSGRFLSILETFDRYLRQERPDAVVLVDYPGLHIGFATLARRRGVRVIYYVCPQLWAWAPWRTRWFSSVVDYALTILPFEEEYFHQRGVEARYVGHPAADDLAAEQQDAEALRLEQEIRASSCGIVLMPGSRRQEVENHLPLMLDVARQIRARIPQARFFVPQIHEDMHRLCAELLARADCPGVSLVDRVTPLLRGARFALVASGTATFEVGYHGVPMVVVYRFPPFQRFMGSQLITVPWISLVNVIAGQELVPEFVNAGEPADAIAAASLELIQDTPARRACLEALSRTLRPAFSPGATARAASEILECLARWGAACA